jgi:hypothetical protein
VFRNSASFAKASQKNILNIPEAMFFNKAGNMVRYKKETVDCNANVDDFISDLEHFSNIEADESFTISELKTIIKTSSSDSLQNADINVFITWTVYAGKLNKDKAFEWAKLLETAKSKGINVRYYLLNCDYQKSWNISKTALEKMGVKS